MIPLIHEAAPRHPVHSQGRERSSLHTPQPVRGGLSMESTASSGQLPRLQNHSRSGVTGWPLLVLSSSPDSWGGPVSLGRSPSCVHTQPRWLPPGLAATPLKPYVRPSVPQAGSSIPSRWLPRRVLWFYCGTDTRLRSERGPRTQSFHPGPIQGLRGPGVDSTLHPHQKRPGTVDSGPPSRLFLQVPLARGINHSSQTPWVEFLQGLLQAACQHVIHSSHEKKGAELDLFTPPPRSLTPDLLERSRDSRDAMSSWL